MILITYWVARRATAHGARPRRTERGRYHGGEVQLDPSCFEHTLLRADASAPDVRQLCNEAMRLGCRAVCVNPSRVQLASESLRGEDVIVCGVIAFPLGATPWAIKVAEVGTARCLGAGELDVVIDVGAVVDERWEEVREGVEMVCDAAEGAAVKVIIESAALTEAHIVTVSTLVAQTRAAFIKTSTGLHPAGGATPDAVSLVRRTVGDAVGIKAAGGIRTAASARAMLEAGATVLGSSATVAIFAELA